MSNSKTFVGCIFYSLQLIKIFALFLCFFSLFLIENVESSSVLNREKERKIVNQILDDNNYDKKIRPAGANDTNATIVSVNLYVRSIDKIDDVKMEYSMQLTFRMQWLDSRLAYNDFEKDYQNKIPYLTLTDLDRPIWEPDLFFSNERKSHRHELLLPNKYIRIFPDGFVLSSERISLTLSCPMILKLFPLDKQTCSLRMASYGYTTADIIFKWKKDDPVQVTPDLHLPKFTLQLFTTDYCDSHTNTGVYSCLRVDLLFKREFSYYLTQVYIPTLMLVIVSWLSFWIHPKKVTARIMLTFGPILMLTMLGLHYNALFPQVSYTTAMDIWLGVCLTFLFGSLVQFVITHYLSRGKVEIESNKRQNWISIQAFLSLSVTEKIDVGARFLYAVLFIFFNFVYWTGYRGIKDKNEKN